MHPMSLRLSLRVFRAKIESCHITTITKRFSVIAIPPPYPFRIYPIKIERTWEALGGPAGRKEYRAPGYLKI
jgi:hypothetical protein